MTGLPHAKPGDGLATLVEIVLEGGPALPPELHPGRVPADTRVVKIEYYGGHERFERYTAPADGPVVFRWTGRTRVAE